MTQKKDTVRRAILGEKLMNKKKIGRFIYYFLGVLLPFLIAPYFQFICDPRQDPALMAFLVIGILSHIFASKLAINYKFINPENFLSNESIIPFVGAIFIWLLVAFGIFAPSVRCSDFSESVKNRLVNGTKECMIRDYENMTTNFFDVDSFTSDLSKYDFGDFKIEAVDINSCYKAKAITNNDYYTWFEIDYDPGTGKTSKTCGDSSKQGCEEGNTW